MMKATKRRIALAIVIPLYTLLAAAGVGLAGFVIYMIFLLVWNFPAQVGVVVLVGAVLAASEWAHNYLNNEDEVEQ